MTDTEMTDTGLRRRFDEHLSRFDVPVLVVTAFDGRDRAGCLVSLHCQVSIHPHHYLIALSPRNHTARVAAASDHLVVHTLPAERRDLAVVFGGRCSRDDGTFERVGWQPWQDGTPILEEAAGWFVGAPVARHDLGDHVGLTLGVVAASPAPVTPLLTTAGLGRLPAGHAP